LKHATFIKFGNRFCNIATPRASSKQANPHKIVVEISDIPKKNEE
jgi:hypothetical protein